MTARWKGQELWFHLCRDSKRNKAYLPKQSEGEQPKGEYEVDVHGDDIYVVVSEHDSRPVPWKEWFGEADAQR